MGKSDPLLLLDNGTLAYILGNGEYRFTNLKFDEAKAIIEMKGRPRRMWFRFSETLSWSG